MTRLPTTARKPTEQLRRRNPPEQWTSLPAEGCSLPVPEWPSSGRAPELRERLWRLPVALWWHEQRIERSIVAAYVNLAESKPAHANTLNLARELGLTPASMLRMRLIVEEAEPAADEEPDHYAHLKR
jgi:hypothetical protein